MQYMYGQWRQTNKNLQKLQASLMCDILTVHQDINILSSLISCGGVFFHVYRHASVLDTGEGALCRYSWSFWYFFETAIVSVHFTNKMSFVTKYRVVLSCCNVSLHIHLHVPQSRMDFLTWKINQAQKVTKHYWNILLVAVTCTCP